MYFNSPLFYSMAVVYTDLLRRAAETHGPDSPGMLRALRDIDDVLQAKLKDIKAKADHKGQAHHMFSQFLNVQIYEFFFTKFSFILFSSLNNQLRIPYFCNNFFVYLLFEYFY